MDRQVLVSEAIAWAGSMTNQPATSGAEARRIRWTPPILASIAVVGGGSVALATATEISTQTAVFGTNGVALLAMGVIGWGCLKLTTAEAGHQPITLATWITLARGWLAVLFAGVLAAGILAPNGSRLYWLAASIFLVSAVLDMVDGAVARRMNSETEFGDRLDTEIDALLIGIGTIGAVIDGTVPILFLTVGGARYCFVAAGYLRRRRGLSYAELEPRLRRKLNGGVIMATVLIAVAPPTSGRLSWGLAGIVIPVTIGFFIWDWLAVAGHRASNHN